MKSKSQRGAATRQRLVDAASKLMAQRGFHATSVDDILQESATGKSQFYHYFASKDSLVATLVAQLAPLMPLVRLAEAATGTSFDGLEGELDRLVEDYEKGDYGEGCVVGNLAGELAGDPRMREALAPSFEAAVAKIAELVRRMRYRGQVRADSDAHEVAHYLAASVQGAFLLARLTGDVAPVRAAARQLKVYLKSLAPRPATRPAMSARPLQTLYCP